MRIVTALCQVPAFGAFGAGSPSFLGGSAGLTDGGTPIDVTMLGGRSIASPGTTIPSNPTDPIRINLMALFASDFDGYASVYALRKGVASPNLLMSFWIKPDVATPQGVIFEGGGATGTPPFPPFSMGYQGLGAVLSGAVGDVGAGQIFWKDASGTPGQLNAAGFTPPALSNGWFHVLLAMQGTASHILFTLYCNETPILTNTTAPFGFTGGVGTAIQNLVWNPGDGNQNIDFAKAETSYQKWVIGGASGRADLALDALGILNTGPGFTLPVTLGGGGDWSYNGNWQPQGDGFKGCMSELWIGEGQYLDITVQANRDKFHNRDVGGNVGPVDLGSDGSLPTGTKPTIYCTGTPSQFPVNRATGKLFAVYHDSSRAGGLQNILPICNDAGPS